jgi:hypothetical protein
LLSTTTLDNRKRLQLCVATTLNLFSGVDIVTELAQGHQLAHARKPGMKNKLSEFSFPMT